jgi:hypothetical protein
VGTHEEYQQFRARQDLADIAQYTRDQQQRQRGPMGGYRPQPQVTHVNINLTPVVLFVRAWNRFARRHLPKPLHMTINTIVILFVVLLVVSFVWKLDGH